MWQDGGSCTDLILQRLCLTHEPSFCFLSPSTPPTPPPHHPHRLHCLSLTPAELTLGLSHMSLSRQVGVEARRKGQLSSDYRPGFVFLWLLSLAGEWDPEYGTL